MGAPIRHETNRDAVKRGSVGHETDADAVKRGSIGHETGRDAVKRGSVGHETDCDAVKRGSIGHETDRDAVKRSTIGRAQQTLFSQDDGHTPLHIAAWEGDDQMLRFFHQHRANPNIVDKVSRATSSRYLAAADWRCRLVMRARERPASETPAVD